MGARGGESGADCRWMRRAIALARKGEGWTRPNPPVGAVVVRNDHRVGEGWHRKAGAAHAEIEALKAAGDRARGACLYVTLEPCSTYGRTPPCTDAIVRAGIRRVVYGAEDPNPRHSGRARSLLDRAGIEVLSGVCAEECEALIRPFRTWVLNGRPHVTLKLALTLDGRIADAKGCSRWITGEAARRCVHAIRRRVDAILVGAGTIRADDPTLLPRDPNAPPVFRVVVAGDGDLPAGARVFCDTAATRTIVAAPGDVSPDSVRAWSANGATVWKFRRSRLGIHLGAVLRRLGREGFLHVLCEGGGRLAANLLWRKLVDDMILFYAPAILLGGTSGFQGEPLPLQRAIRGRMGPMRRVGSDWMVHFIPAWGEDKCSRD